MKEKLARLTSNGKRLYIYSMAILLTVNIILGMIAVGGVYSVRAADVSASTASQLASGLNTAGNTVTLTGDITLGTGESIQLNTAGTFTISGDYTISRGSALTSSPLFTIGSGVTLVLDGVTIDGNKDSVTATAPLIAVSGGTLNMLNGATLQNNNNTSTSSLGGAVALTGGTVSGGYITDCESSAGGGVYAVSGANTITGCTITNNAVNPAAGNACGGGLYIAADTTTLYKNVTINGNTGTAVSGSTVEGAGVYLASDAGLTISQTSDTTPVTANVVISGNYYTTTSGSTSTDVPSNLFRGGSSASIALNGAVTGVIGINNLLTDGTAIATSTISSMNDTNYTGVFIPDSGTAAVVESGTASDFTLAFDSDNTIAYSNITINSTGNGSVFPCGTVRVRPHSASNPSTLAISILPDAYNAVGSVSVDSVAINLGTDTNYTAGTVASGVDKILHPVADSYTVTATTDTGSESKTVGVTFSELYTERALTVSSIDSASITGNRIYTAATAAYTTLPTAATIPAPVTDKDVVLFAGSITLASNSTTYTTPQYGTVDLTLGGYSGKTVKVLRLNSDYSANGSAQAGTVSSSGNLSVTGLSSGEMFVVYTQASTTNEVSLKVDTNNAVEYETLSDAITYINSHSGNSATSYVITLLRDIKLDSKLTVTKNFTISSPKATDGSISEYCYIYRARTLGSAMFAINSGCTLTLSSVTLDGTKEQSGVAVVAPLVECSGTLVFDGVSGLRNNANTASSGKGGALILSGGKVYANALTDNIVHITNCSAAEGGGIYADVTASEIGNGITISDCSATNGGGVYAAQGTVIRSATIINNSCTTYGGGIYAPNGLSIRESPFVTENIKQGTTTNTANNLYLGTGTYIMVVDTLGAGAKIGIINPSTGTFAKKSNSSLSTDDFKTYVDRFFPDGSTPVQILPNSDFSELVLKSAATTYKYYTVESSIGEGEGTIAPLGTVRAPGKQVYVITPASGSKISAVTIWTGDGTPTEVDRDKLNISDYIATYEYNLTSSTAADSAVRYIEASFEEIGDDVELTVTFDNGTCLDITSTNTAVPNNSKVTTADGSSRTFKFTMSSEEYELDSLKLGTTEITPTLSTDGKYYTVTLNDISADSSTLAAKFKKVYNSRTLAPATTDTLNGKVSITGSSIHNDSQLVLKLLPDTDTSYKQVSSSISTDSKLSLLSVYDIDITSESRPTKPFTGTVSVKIFVGTSYKTASVYHVTSSTTIDKTTYKDLTVDSSGYVTLTNVSSFSPYAVVVSSTGSNGDTDADTGEDSTPLIVVGIIMGVALIVLIISSGIMTKKKKKNAQADNSASCDLSEPGNHNNQPR